MLSFNNSILKITKLIGSLGQRPQQPQSLKILKNDKFNQNFSTPKMVDQKQLKEEIRLMSLRNKYYKRLTALRNSARGLEKYRNKNPWLLWWPVKKGPPHVGNRKSLGQFMEPGPVEWVRTYIPQGFLPVFSLVSTIP